MKKEYDLRKLKVKARGPVIGGSARVPLRIEIDADVLRWLVAQAARQGTSEQTLVNAVLREAMAANPVERENLRTEIRKIVRQEIKRAS
jgi:uncharacterized protein (DUF4415 family)